MTIRNLPIIVDSTGKYITRDGRLVVVHEIKKIEDENTTSFNVKGIIKISGQCWSLAHR